MTSNQHPRSIQVPNGIIPQEVIMSRPVPLGSPYDFHYVPGPNPNASSSSAQIQDASFALSRPNIPDDDYFVIGQKVFVRSRSTNSGWRAATVIAPVMFEYEQGRKEERMYRVVLLDEHGTGEIAAFSPRGEICAMPLEYAHHGAEAVSNLYCFGDFILAQIYRCGAPKWVPAIYIKQTTQNSHSIMILAGEREGQWYTTRQIRPHVG